MTEKPSKRPFSCTINAAIFQKGQVIVNNELMGTGHVSVFPADDVVQQVWPEQIELLPKTRAESFEA
jgi:hypothetical protein